MLNRFSKWLIKRPERSYGPADAIGWWEFRRIPFNLLIGIYGLPCLILTYWAADRSGKLPPGEDVVEPMALMILPFVINALYTLGWLVEAPIRLVHPTLSNRFGPLLFMSGLALGWFLCTIPAACAVGLWLLP